VTYTPRPIDRVEAETTRLFSAQERGEAFMNPYDAGSEKNLSQDGARPLARITARELTRDEIAAAAGRTDTTTATGPNGDDPSDPDWNM